MQYVFAKPKIAIRIHHFAIFLFLRDLCVSVVKQCLALNPRRSAAGDVHQLF